MSPVEWRPGLRRVQAWWAAWWAASPLALAALVVYENFLAPYNAYRASLVPSLSSAEYERLDDAVLRLPSVEAVGGSSPPDEGITVWFEHGLSNEGRERLGQSLISFPEIRRVDLCRC